MKKHFDMQIKPAAGGAGTLNHFNMDKLNAQLLRLKKKKKKKKKILASNTAN